MCRSSVTLFYGLWVKSWSLAFAADAYGQINPTLLGIDLIARRWREGKLEVEEQEMKTTARDLPSEVWELVKQELIDVALEKQAAVQLACYRCPSCRNALGQSTEYEQKHYPELLTETRDLTDVWTCWEDLKCKRCIEWIGVGAFRWMKSGGRRAEVERLLSLYQLCMPSTAAHLEDYTSFDLNELSPVALPLRSSSTNWTLFNRPQVESDRIHKDDGDFADHDAYNLETSCLSIPADAELRFRRLIHTYRLWVVDPTKSTIVPLSERQPLSSAVSSTHQTIAEQEKPFDEAEPRWMLWSFAELCC
ncbi:hypothetical protein BCR35DRAFT_330751 [Leucosporidium creatinivorum]|uniref:Uncharacterized protein n=1 Tax=Leucosporidium creatinivorum TaxID=106004 RepID=A0A1Y2FQ05_9BASI|nr:hypothetical protein BCR35DRAFT_330751 [Leucosporidium creatinivorum]